MDALSLRAATLLGLAGASLALFFQQLGGRWVTGFIARNELSLANRRVMLVTMAVGFALGAGASLLVRWIRGAGVTNRLRALAWLLAPLALLGLVPGLLRAEAWEPVPAGLALALLGLLVEEALVVAGKGWPLLHAEQPGLRARPWWQASVSRWRSLRAQLYPLASALSAPRATFAAAVLGWLGFGSIFAGLAVRLLRRGLLPSTELGLWHAVLHGTSLPSAQLFTTEWSEPVRGMMFHPTAWVLWLLTRGNAPAEVLLVARALVAAAGGLFLWALAERRLSGARLWLLLLAFFLWPAWQASLLSDFSLVPFAATFVLAGFAAWVRREKGMAALAFLLAFGCGEAGIAMVLCVGVGALLRPQTRAWGAVLALLGVLGTAALAVVGAARVPSYVPSLLQPLQALWAVPQNIVFSWVSLDRLAYLVQIVAPFALLPLRGSGRGLAVLPGLVLVVGATTLDHDYARAGIFVAWVAPALAKSLATARRSRLAALLVTVVMASVLWGLLPPRREARAFSWLGQVNLTEPSEAVARKRRAELDAMAAVAPPGLLLVPASELFYVHPPRGVDLGPIPRAFSPEARSVILGASAGVPGFELTAPAHAVGFRFVKTIGPWILFAR